MNDLRQKILTAVEDDLDDIEKALSDNLNPYLDLVSDVAGHILFNIVYHKLYSNFFSKKRTII